ncbi:hypothetical protein GV827_21450 [Sulfitobacter sp. JBTF-M27]|uniref:Uncharacterized protein n=1 Tax=Sulfitobacter sediminilitoris TaxID=2698830 RepID=A0A6P0CHS4_9RHOB|nr:BTAD domain-containing putative transcriptional regulator [Sulfitobacter sediminilitoris]NEK24940.1 hypothetical protein [Sulfitobacter sediminilitoris]
MELNLFGKFTLTKDGEPVELRNKKAQALLVYLALTDQPHSRTHLATILWGERFEEQARSSLRQALYALRKAVGDGLVIGDDRLSLANGALRLKENGSGGMLDDFFLAEEAFDTWLDTTREKHRKDAAFAAFEKARQQEKAGDPEGALATIRVAAVLQPLDEQIARMKIALLAGLGKRTEALADYTKFTSLLEHELDAAPQSEIVELAERIRADDAPAATAKSTEKAAPSDGAGGFNILIAPFDDLGGGDTATFLAHDLPGQIVHATSHGLITVNLLPEAKSCDEGKTQMERASEADAVWLLSGSVRQIGSRVRISLTGSDVKTGNVAATDAKLISEDEAFEYLDGVSDTVSAMWRSRYMKLGRYDQVVIDRLKLARNQPEQFHSISQDFFYQTFYSDYSRASLSALENVADFAISEFPNQAHYHSIKGWAHFSYTDLLDANTRLEGIRTAKSIFEHALLLKPDQVIILLGLASASYWLGYHDEAEELLARSNISATAVPLVDVIRGNSAMFCGRNDEAIAMLNRVIENGAGLAPLANWYATLAMAHFNKSSYENALSSANVALEFSSEYWLSYLARMASLSRLGRLSEAHETVSAYHAEYPAANVHELEWLPFTDELVKRNFLDALLDAGLPE